MKHFHLPKRVSSIDRATSYARIVSKNEYMPIYVIEKEDGFEIHRHHTLPTVHVILTFHRGKPSIPG